MALLEISNLTVTIVDPLTGLDVPLVDRVSLNIQAGEFAGLIGETGSGKSVIARILGGYIRDQWNITCQSFRVNGEEILLDTGRIDTSKLAGVVGVIDQDPANIIDPSVKIGKQLLDRMSLVPRWRKLMWNKRKKMRKEIADLFTRMGIKEAELILNSYYADLSQTEQHLMAIAMTIVTDPILLIADEPTTGLNAISTQRVQALFKRLNANLNKTILYLSNNFLTVKNIVNTATIMYFGQVVERFYNVQDIKEQILTHAHHPYTRLFLQSLPDFTNNRLIYKTSLYEIPGELPELANVPIGCRFGPRCAFAQRKCMQAPSLTKLRDNLNSEFACFYPVDYMNATQQENLRDLVAQSKKDMAQRLQLEQAVSRTPEE